MIEILQIGVLLLLLNPLIKLVRDDYFELNDKFFGIGLYGRMFSITMGNIFGGRIWALHCFGFGDYHNRNIY